MRIRHGFLVVSLTALVRAAALGAVVVLTSMVALETTWAQEAQKDGKPTHPDWLDLRGAEAEADEAIRRCDASGFSSARNKMIEIVDGSIRGFTDKLNGLNAQGGGNTQAIEDDRRIYTNQRRRLENYRTALRNWKPAFPNCATPATPAPTRSTVPGAGTTPAIETWEETAARIRRETERAADEVFRLGEECYSSFSGLTKEKQDELTRKIEQAQAALEQAIWIEAGLSDEVRSANREYANAVSYNLYTREESNNAQSQRPGAAARLQEADRAREEARERQKARVRARLEALRQTTPQTPRKTSCGPSLATSGVQVAMGGRSTTVNVATVNAGTQISGGVESPIATSARRLSGGGGFFSVMTPGAGPVNNFFFNVAFDQFSASTSGSVPVGGASVAQTYIFPNPNGGSTGIAAGATGQSVSTQTDGRQFDAIVGARLTSPLAPINFINTGGGPTSARVVAFEFDAGIRYRNMRRTDSITQQSTTFAGLNSVIDLSATSNFFAPHLGAGIVITPPGPSGVFGGVRGYVSPGFQTTSATATQNSRCNVCGGGSPETNITLQRDFSSNKFSVISGAIAYFGYQINPNSKLLLEVAYENQSAAPVFSVPTSPTQQPITLSTGSTDTFRVGGKFLISFAP